MERLLGLQAPVLRAQAASKLLTVPESTAAGTVALDKGFAARQQLPTRTRAATRPVSMGFRAHAPT